MRLFDLRERYALLGLVFAFFIRIRNLANLFRLKKEHLRYLLSGAYLLMAVGIGALLLSQTKAMIYVFLVFYGLGSGAELPIQLLAASRYFGRKAFTSIQGILMMVASPIGFVAPIYAGWTYDTTGSYLGAFIVFAATATIATFFMLIIRPPKPPAQITDVRKFV